ncbi:uncharacterized protein LOC125371377 [Ricinus communis]|uniref:uncharacterized protein LOC125371377 n=1 Tax=Ricinus communis TaxID=3988 RepID=UPI00201AB118|nr:uncharacterized protein LOC125371377 [Ricinus communis]
MSFNIGCNHLEVVPSNLFSLLTDFIVKTFLQVAVATRMVNTSRLMRCYVKGPSSSPVLQFSNNDTGYGAGIAFWPIFLSFEQLAEKLVQMFIFELNLKRLLVVELLTLSSEGPQVNELRWSNELYPGEIDDLSICNLYSMETCKPVPLDRRKRVQMPTMQFKSRPNREVLQVYLTTWLAEEVSIHTHR